MLKNQINTCKIQCILEYPKCPCYKYVLCVQFRERGGEREREMKNWGKRREILDRQIQASPSSAARSSPRSLSVTRCASEIHCSNCVSPPPMSPLTTSSGVHQSLRAPSSVASLPNSVASLPISEFTVLWAWRASRSLSSLVYGRAMPISEATTNAGEGFWGFGILRFFFNF